MLLHFLSRVLRAKEARRLESSVMSKGDNSEKNGEIQLEAV